MSHGRSCESEEYVVVTCDSDSISSYYVDASCDDSYTTIDCSTYSKGKCSSCGYSSCKCSKYSSSSSSCSGSNSSSCGSSSCKCSKCSSSSPSCSGSNSSSSCSGSNSSSCGSSSCKCSKCSSSSSSCSGRSRSSKCYKSSSSKCCCSSSSDCSSCQYCCRSSSTDCCAESGYVDYHGGHYQPCHTSQQSLSQLSPVINTTQIETPTSLPPSTVPAPRNKSLRSVVTPVMDLRTPFSANDGTVAFTMRRRNDVVTLQHEPFSATIAQNGANHIAVRQSIGDLPAHPVNFPFNYRLRGQGKIGFIRIDPLDASANIKFYFDTDDRQTVNAGDNFEVDGTSVSWITSY